MSYRIKKIKAYPHKEINWDNKAYISMSMNNTMLKDHDSTSHIIEEISSHVNNITVIVGDYLHRYNEMIFYGLGEEEGIIKSRNKGGELVSNFMSCAVKYANTFSYSFIYSKEFLYRPIYNEKLQRFATLLTTNERFNELVEYTVDVFLRRQNAIKISLEKAKGLCRSYLLEELVIFEMLAEEGYKVNIYPGNQLPIIKEIATGKLKGVSEPLEGIQAIEIRFRPKN